MTLSELLEGLKQVDPDTWDVVVRGIPLKPFCQYFTFDRCGQRAHQYPDVYLPFSQMERDVALAWLQGCIQRACERYGWELEQNYRTRSQNGDLPKNIRHYAVVTSWDNDVHTYRGMGNSATKALLAAYVAAVKEEKR